VDPASLAHLCVRIDKKQQLQNELKRMQDELRSMRVGHSAVAPKCSDIDARPMSFEEKQALCASIQTLPVEHLNMIVNIIQQGMPQSVQGGEIEIDIDAMPPMMRCCGRSSVTLQEWGRRMEEQVKLGRIKLPTCNHKVPQPINIFIFE